MPLKIAIQCLLSLSVIDIYIYVLKCGLMKVFRLYLCRPMVFMCSFGSVSFGVGLKGKEGHAFEPSKNNQITTYYLYIFQYAYDSSPDEVLPKTNILTVPLHGVHLYFGLGAVWGWAKGKGRPRFWTLKE